MERTICLARMLARASAFVRIIGERREAVGWVTRLGDRSFIAEQRAKFRISENLFNRFRLTIYAEFSVHETNALAVINPGGGVFEVEGLDGEAVGLMPAVNGDLSFGGSEAGGYDEIFLMTGGEAAQRMI